MAHFSLVSLMNTLEQMVTSDIFTIFHVNQHVLSLYRKVRFLQELLHESPETSSQGQDLQTRIKDAAYITEDIIDFHLSQQILSDPKRFIKQMSSLPVNNSLRGKKYQDLEQAIGEFDSIAGELLRDRCGLKIILPRKYIPVGLESSRPARSAKIRMVGFHPDMVEIKDRLTGQEKNLLIISIVGMGGIGKTTLAKNVYDDSLVKSHFDRRAWVTISQTYHVRKVLIRILLEIGAAPDQLLKKSAKDLRLELHRNLSGRRYLIVLDDVWNTNAWDDFRMIFPENDKGSRLILTTRLFKVANYATGPSTTPHQMKLLDDSQCWDLLQQEVFGDEDCPQELQGTGKVIARNCRGLPLTASVVGGLLASSNKSVENWEYVAENVNSVAINNNEHCLEILSLSYHHLPHSLRACFLFLGAFQDDSEIYIPKLIRLWVAEGTVKPVVSKSMEEAAEGCLNDLIDRNLVYVQRRGSNGKVKVCGMHDLLKDLCIKKAQQENFLYVIKKHRHAHFPSEGSNSCRRLSMNLDILEDDERTDDIGKLMQSMPYTRAMLYNGYILSTTPFYSSFRLLRTLDFFESDLPKFPDEILKLVNLKYLALSIHNYPVLPSQISQLWKLQFLIARDHQNVLNKDIFPYFKSYFEVYPPSAILQMAQLRYLQVTEIFLPDSIYEGNNTAVMKNLETLSMISNFRCSEEFLGKFPNIRKLGVYYYGAHIEDWSGYRLKNLVKLVALENLKCIFNWPPNETLSSNLMFPRSLTKLTLHGSKLLWKDMTIIGSLPNLEVLKLKEYAFVGQTWESVEGEFSLLKFLLIDRTNLSEWIGESTHFPYLEHLIITRCGNLREIPSGIGEIDTLKMIEIDESSSFVVDSAKEILKEQQSLENYDLEVRIHQHYKGPTSFKVPTAFLMDEMRTRSVPKFRINHPTTGVSGSSSERRMHQTSPFVKRLVYPRRRR